MNDIEIYLYQPRDAALAVLATLRGALPPTEERHVSDARVILRGDLGDQPLPTLCHALQRVERLHANWRELMTVTAVDARRVAL